MLYVPPRTWTPGDTPTAAQLNQDLRDNMLHVANLPRARVYNTVDQSIANGSWQVVTFNAERWDTDTIHSVSSQTSRLTGKTAGLYRILANAAFASNATGIRGIRILYNGATEIYQKLTGATNGNLTGMDAATEWVLAVNDYIELSVFQNSGAALNLITSYPSGNYSPEFSMTLATGW